MTTVTDHTIILDQLSWRYSTKKFDSTRKISDSDWHILEESLRLAPSSFGLQPWCFWVVQSSEIRQELLPASYNQMQIPDCSHLVVITHLKEMSKAYIHRYIESISTIRNVTLEALGGFEDRMVGFVDEMGEGVSEWTGRQAYIAMGAFLTTAAIMGIDVCPIEGISTSQYDKILHIDETPYTALAVMATGYRAADDKISKKVRFDRDSVIKTV